MIELCFRHFSFVIYLHKCILKIEIQYFKLQFYNMVFSLIRSLAFPGSLKDHSLKKKVLKIFLSPKKNTLFENYSKCHMAFSTNF